MSREVGSSVSSITTIMVSPWALRPLSRSLIQEVSERRYMWLWYPNPVLDSLGLLTYFVPLPRSRSETVLREVLQKLQKVKVVQFASPEEHYPYARMRTSTSDILRQVFTVTVDNCILLLTLFLLCFPLRLSFFDFCQRNCLRLYSRISFCLHPKYFKHFLLQK